MKQWLNENFGVMKTWFGNIDQPAFNMTEFKKDLEDRRVELRSRPVFKHLVEEHNREPDTWTLDRELDVWHAALHAVGGHEAAQRHGE